LFSDIININVIDVSRNIVIDFVESEPSVNHFVDSVFLACVPEHNPVHRNDQSGSVGAVMTVYQDWTFPVFDDSKRRHDVEIVGVMSVHLDSVQNQIRSFGVSVVGMPVSQVENFFDSVFFQRSKLFFVWLFRAINAVIDHIHIRQSAIVYLDRRLRKQ
jgi:hypothetical protein